MIRKTFLLSLLIIFCTQVRAQEFFNDFEDGTLQGWTNIDGSTTNMDVLLDDSQYLLKLADGSATPEGRMSIANVTDTWTGNNYGSPGSPSYFASLNMQIRNSNSFDLKLRLGFRGGSDDTILVTTNPITIPPGTWASYDFPTYDATTVVSGKATLEEVATNTLEFRIIHSEEVTWEGDIENGSFEIDNLEGVILNIEEFSERSVSISPNPFRDKIQVQISEGAGEIKIFDVLGREIFSKPLNSITTLDLQGLNSGIYLAKISTESGSITKRIIKN